jgi:U3 small nucleolar RNA-associated protein 3
MNPTLDLTHHPVVSAIVKAKSRLEQLMEFENESLLNEIKVLVNWANEDENQVLEKASEVSEVSEVLSEVSEASEVLSEASEVLSEKLNELEASTISKSDIDIPFVSLKGIKRRVNRLNESTSLVESGKQTIDRHVRSVDAMVKKRQKREKYAGDDDVPYRSRRKPSPVPFSSPMESPDNESMPAEESFQMLSKKKERALQRQKIAEEARLTGSRLAMESHQHSLADGKRAISYAILKNKGLTPHRKKEQRNPRVKQRNKYVKAQKRLKSQTQVVRPQGGTYSGEATGIKKNISKSVLFS